MAISYHDVFLSHNSDDKPAVEELAQRLVQEGLQPWLDSWNLIPGAPWQKAIEEALDACMTCAVFIGPNGMGSWQHEEMRRAIDRRVKDTKGVFRVIPVLLPGTERGERSTLPDFLTATTWVEFRTTLDDEEAFHRLVCGIRGIEPGPGSAGEMCTGATPYRGLQVFDVGDWPFFFGREALIEWLLDALRPGKILQPESRFLGIIGPSGSGKSSLTRAGLVAAMEQGKLPGSEHWRVAIYKPGSAPLESLAIAVGAVTGNGPNVAATRDLIRCLREDTHALHLATSTALQGAPERRLVVLVDQFEEVFTLCHDTEQQKAVIEALLYAATTPHGQTIVVLTMRADFYGKCAAYPALAAALSDHQMLVGPMTADELRRAIERPALLRGCEFEPGLVTRLLNDVHEQVACLPFMQHALLELWNRRAGRRLTHKVYEDIGGIAGAIEHRAETVYIQLTESEQQICQRIFLRLTQPGEGTEDTKRRATLRELLPAGDDVTAFETVLHALADKDVRLITIERASAQRIASNGQDDREAIGVEVAHEALIRSWSRLRGWIDADRTAILVHRQLTVAAAEWVNNQQDLSYLYAGARLATAQEWAESHPSELNADELIFLQASLVERDQKIQEREEQQKQKVRLEEEQRRAVRLRLFLLVAGLLLVLAIYSQQTANRSATDAEQARATAEGARINAEQAHVTAEGARINAEQARTDAEQSRAIAQSLARAGEALFELNSRPERALALALAAQPASSAPTEPMISRAAYDTFADDLIYKVLKEHNGSVSVVAWSPDGKHVLTGSLDNTARLWDVTSGRALHTLSGHSNWISAVAWSPDGKLTLTSSTDNTARLWDVASGRALHTLRGHSNSISAVAWSPDGKHVLTGSWDNTAQLWDVASGRVVHTLSDHSDAINAVAWSPDGKQVLTGSTDNTARLWDVASGRALHTLRGHIDEISAVAWSPDGKHVLTGSLDNTARLWDVANGQQLHMLIGHTQLVYPVAWSPDGKHVLTGSWDNTARLWDVASGRALHTLRGHSHWISAAAWSPDGKLVLTSSRDNTARLWLVDQQLIVAALTQRLCVVYQQDDAAIRSQVSDWGWRGCEEEIRAVDTDIKTYKALFGAK